MVACSPPIRRYPLVSQDGTRQALEQSSARLDAWLAQDESTPSQTAAKIEQLIELAAALAGLPEDQRTAIELHHVHGLTVPELARHMEKTAASVTGLLYRGGKVLRQQLRVSD
jgi:RNA polymerase sigma-70 factor (ECF subfamily)